MNDLQESLALFVRSLSPSERKKLLRKIGKMLRQKTVRNMQQQRDPDGQRWIERKRGKEAMFRRLRKPRFFKEKIDDKRLQLGWFGRHGTIATQHHEGGHYQLQGKNYRYPQRLLLGLNDAQKQEMKQLILQHFQNAIDSG